MRLYSYTYPEIAKTLGMHHSSIIYLNDYFDIIFPQDYDFRVQYNEIEKKIMVHYQSLILPFVQKLKDNLTHKNQHHLLPVFEIPTGPEVRD